MSGRIHQCSDWSNTQSTWVRCKSSSNRSNQKRNRKKDLKLKIDRCCSSIPPFIRGLLLGIFVGCILLSIALILWLTTPANITTTPNTSMTTIPNTSITTTPNTSITTTSNTNITTTGKTDLTTSVTNVNTTITYARTGIYALTVPTCATWQNTAITVAGNSNGSPGNDLCSLNSPVSIFIDNDDNLVIADRDNNRVMKYYPNASLGIVIAGNGTQGMAPQLLNQLKGVAVDQSGATIVADSSNYRIQKFPNGSTTGITLFTNTPSSPLGQMRDLHIDVNNNIYITDSDYRQVVKYTPYSPNGIVLAGGNIGGSGNNQLNFPYGNFIDENNILYVADSGSNVIWKYLPGSTVGTVAAGINGSYGTALNLLHGPMAVTVDNNGYLYIAEYNNNRITKWTTNYSAGGTCIFGCTAIAGATNDKLNKPRDIKFDKYGNLYISDQGNHRIQKLLIDTSCSTGR